MRSAGNFHPEWGYLAPKPSFVRTLRIVLVATAIGATAGAGVVVSLLPHRASGGTDSSIAAHALLTSAPAANTTAAIAPAQPAAAAAASQAQAAALSGQPAAASPQQGGRPDEIGAAGTNAASTAAPPQSIGAPDAASGAAPTRVAHVEEPALAAPDHEDTAPLPEAAPGKKPVTKRHRVSGYEAIRRWQAARGEAKKPRHGEGGLEPLFRLFSSRTSSPFSAN